MSTPPTPPPLPQNEATLPPRQGRSTLAKLAITFAVTIVIAFGLCSVTLIRSTSAISGPILSAAVIIEAICAAGLIVVAILALARKNGD